MGVLDHKENWVLKNWRFQTVVLEKTLDSPLDCKEIKPVNPKGNQQQRDLSDNMEQFVLSCSVVSDSLQPHELQHARLLCPSLSPWVCPYSCPLSQWCHPAISSSVASFSSCPQSFSASGSFPMSWLFAWGGQSIGVSASKSVLSMNIQDWLPLGLTGLISLLSKELSRVFF